MPFDLIISFQVCYFHQDTMTHNTETSNKNYLNTFSQFRYQVIGKPRKRQTESAPYIINYELNIIKNDSHTMHISKSLLKINDIFKYLHNKDVIFVSTNRKLCQLQFPRKADEAQTCCFHFDFQKEAKAWTAYKSINSQSHQLPIHNLMTVYWQNETF